MKRTTTTILVGVAALLLAGAGLAMGSIPDAAGVIHACRDTKTGALRVIDTDAGQRCAKGEAALAWNQTGPAGPAEPHGAQGPAGPAGPAGVGGSEVVSQTTTCDVVACQAPGLGGAAPPGPIEFTLTCPGGKKVVQTGWKTGPHLPLPAGWRESDVNGGAETSGRNGPVDAGRGWHVQFYVRPAAVYDQTGHLTATTTDVTFSATCALAS